MEWFWIYCCLILWHLLWHSIGHETPNWLDSNTWPWLIPSWSEQSCYQLNHLQVMSCSWSHGRRMPGIKTEHCYYICQTMRATPLLGSTNRVSTCRFTHLFWKASTDAIFFVPILCAVWPRATHKAQRKGFLYWCRNVTGLMGICSRWRHRTSFYPSQHRVFALLWRYIMVLGLNR